MTDRTLTANNQLTKQLVLGCCSTGAKFTPGNHKETGNRLFDAICCGDTVPVSMADFEEELRYVYASGCRYYHIHARNPETREQSCENELYEAYGRYIFKRYPDMALSYGASRNGAEVMTSIASDGEWSRVSQIGLAPENGGAQFVTAQAAVELQIACDLERQGFIQLDYQKGDFQILRPLGEYEPCTLSRKVELEVNSTDNGKDYGQSSPHLQYKVLMKSLALRQSMSLPFEVEWVQHARSRFLTWFMMHHMGGHLAKIGRLNITLLFGFSPKLPFPTTYSEFKSVVDHARGIADGHPLQNEIKITVSVGAAVLPHHSERYFLPMDVGPNTGELLSPSDRIVAYAAQPCSGVDIARVGMEDTPYKLDGMGRLLPTTNAELVENAKQVILCNGAQIADHCESTAVASREQRSRGVVTQPLELRPNEQKHPTLAV